MDLTSSSYTLLAQSEPDGEGNQRTFVLTTGLGKDDTRELGGRNLEGDEAAAARPALGGGGIFLASVEGLEEARDNLLLADPREADDQRGGGPEPATDTNHQTLAEARVPDPHADQRLRRGGRQATRRRPARHPLVGAGR